MTLETFLSLLSSVSGPRHDRYKSTCPAHADTHPSLSIQAGEHAILLRCWSGCSPKEIMAALKLPMRSLWFDEAINPSAVRKARLAKEKRRLAVARKGREIDTLREADYFVRSRAGLTIGDWSEQQLDTQLALLATAYSLLEVEQC